MDILRSALEQGMAHVFGQLQELDRAPSPDAEEVEPGPMVCSTLRIGGDRPGRLSLQVTRRLCVKIVSLLFPGVPANQEAIEDAACELLNMASESTRTLLIQRELNFDVGPPSLVDTDPCVLPPDAIVLRAEHLGETLTLWFTDRTSEEPATTKDG